MDAREEKRIIEQQDVIEDRQEENAFMQPEMPPVQQDAEVSSLILNPQSKFLKSDDKKHKELFTRDVTTSFLDGGDRSVFEQNANLLSHTSSLEVKHDWNLVEFYNMIVRTTHAVNFSSKATGTAPKVAKSQYVEATTRGELIKTTRRKGWFSK